jgi:hypothetical protein
MKLNELTGIKNLQKLSNIDDENMIYNENLSASIIKFMHSNKFKLLGVGLKSVVFENNKSCIKIFYKDYAYEAYIKFIKNIPNEYKKFVPKVLSVRSYPPNPIIKFVKIEKLTHLEIAPFPDFKYLMPLIKQKLNKNNKELSDNVISHQDLFSIINLEKSNEDFLSLFPIEFINFIIYLYNKPNNRRRNFDLHNRNIMMRGNEFVVTDPWV